MVPVRAVTMLHMHSRCPVFRSNPVCQFSDNVSLILQGEKRKSSGYSILDINVFLEQLHAKDTGNSKRREPPAQSHEVITQSPEPSAAWLFSPKAS